MDVVNLSEMVLPQATCTVQNCSEVLIEQCMGFCNAYSPLVQIFIVIIFVVSILKVAVDKWLTEEAGKDLRDKLGWTFVTEGWMTVFRDAVLYNCDLIIFLLSLVIVYQTVAGSIF